MNNIAIITAGGSGSRLPGKRKKQFQMIGGKPLLTYSLDCFIDHPLISAVYLTLPVDDIEYAKSLLAHYPPENLMLVAGGVERQHSVFNALCCLPEKTGLVFIHDGVRPLITKEEITNLAELGVKHGAVIPVHKLKHTVKRVSSGVVTETIDRSVLVETYTPQVFSYQLISACHRKADKDKLLFTDDAAIVEHYGHQVFVHYTERSSIKVTEPEDLEYVTFLLNRKGYTS